MQSAVELLNQERVISNARYGGVGGRGWEGCGQTLNVRHRLARASQRLPPVCTSFTRNCRSKGMTMADIQLVSAEGDTGFMHRPLWEFDPLLDLYREHYVQPQLKTGRKRKQT